MGLGDNAFFKGYHSVTIYHLEETERTQYTNQRNSRRYSAAWFYSFIGFPLPTEAKVWEDDATLPSIHTSYFKIDEFSNCADDDTKERFIRDKKKTSSLFRQ